MFQHRRAARRLLMVTGMITLMLVMTVGWGGGARAQGPGTITGTVFQDYNGNGSRNLDERLANAGSGEVRLAVDRGIPGVTVTAYASTGAVVGTATSAADGGYNLVVSGPGRYRVEFTYPEPALSLYEPGPLGDDNGSTVQFVASTPATGIDLGLIIPSEYCQDNPTLVTSCFKRGAISAMAINEPALLSFPYNAGSESGLAIDDYRVPTDHALSVPVRDVGAIWGLDYAPARDEIYAAAFFKKHISFGPGFDRVLNTDDDPGAIYVVNQTTGLVERVLTVPNATLNDHDVDDFLNDGFNTAWNAVGKTALGGVALAEDEATLYVMNLENRTLYALDAVSGAVLGLQSVPGVPAVAGSGAVGAAPPLRAPATVASCAQDDIRPFAVEYDRGQLFVGITCTAESSGDANQLWAYVYTVDLDTLSFSPNPVFDTSLNYTRGSSLVFPTVSARWQPWVSGFDPAFSFRPGGPASDAIIIYPQPWLTDLSFDNGNLILNLRDRTGDATGYRAPADPSQPGDLFDGIGTGDVLRACGSLATGWTLERNGRCGTPPTGNAPQNDGQGPGDGEFYYDDGYGIRGQIRTHDEVSVGGSVQVPGFPDVVIASFDAFPFFQLNPTINEVYNGGFRWYNNTSGGFDKAYVLYNTRGADPLTMGKANGLGDLIVICDEAPIEIGNLVWRDDDLDGVQGPNEPALAGVVLELYEGDVLIATATTDANGNYLFSSYPGPSDDAFRRGQPLRPNTNYQIRIANGIGPSQQPPLDGLLPTYPENDVTANGTIRDSNGALSGTTVFASVRTGGAGQNNHSYDFGFIIPTPTAITLDSFAARRVGAAVELRWRTSVELEVWGFNLYRSATGRWADAVRVNERTIASQGRGSGGASYSFTDQGVAQGEGPYIYWLEEIPLVGPGVLYGPATTEQLAVNTQTRVLLPFIQR